MTTLDPDRRQSFKKDQPADPRFAWASFSPDQLISCREEIHVALEAKGVPMSLKDVNLERELMLQFYALKNLQKEVLEDDETPRNQQAQVANATGAVLSKVADLQVSVYDSERFKAIENALIRALRLLPEEAAAQFLEEYAKLIGVR